MCSAEQFKLQKYRTVTVEKFTVVFDLDETLSHTTENKEGADAFIPVTTPEKKQIKVVGL